MEHSGIECGSQERIEELQRLLHPQVRAFYKQKLNHPLPGVVFLGLPLPAARAPCFCIFTEAVS